LGSGFADLGPPLPVGSGESDGIWYSVFRKHCLGVREVGYRFPGIGVVVMVFVRGRLAVLLLELSTGHPVAATLVEIDETALPNIRL
jgi:hypothetical protein